MGKQQDTTAFGGPLVLDLFDLLTGSHIKGHGGARHAGVIGASLEENLWGTLDGEEPEAWSITLSLFVALEYSHVSGLKHGSDTTWQGGSEAAGVGHSENTHHELVLAVESKVKLGRPGPLEIFDGL